VPVPVLGSTQNIPANCLWMPATSNLSLRKLNATLTAQSIIAIRSNSPTLAERIRAANRNDSSRGFGLARIIKLDELRRSAGFGKAGVDFTALHLSPARILRLKTPRQTIFVGWVASPVIRCLR
jgi:hypothetical protein